MNPPTTPTETKSETPRADAEILKSYPERSMVPWGFARQLEQELTAANAKLAELSQTKATLQHAACLALATGVGLKDISEGIEHSAAMLAIVELRRKLTALEGENARLKAELQSVRVCFAEASHRDCQAGPEIKALNERLTIAEVACAAKDEALLAFWSDIEARSSDAHDAYQREAHRRGDVRHEDSYVDLSEATKEWDRVLVRWVLHEVKRLIASTSGASLLERLRVAEEANEQMKAEISSTMEMVSRVNTELVQERDAALTKVPRWIPVSERMPTKKDADEFDMILFRCSDGEVIAAHYASRYARYKHWMPIPALTQSETTAP